MPARVEFRLGSIFDEPCDLLVIPSSAGGTVTPEIQMEIRKAGLPFPDVMKNGVSLIKLLNAQWKAVAYAATVSGQSASALAVEEIGRKLGNHAAGQGYRTVGAPLLGAGSGDLASDQAAGALMRGFMSTAPDGALMVISVRNAGRLAALVRTFPHAVGNHIQAPTSASGVDLERLIRLFRGKEANIKGLVPVARENISRLPHRPDSGPADPLVAREAVEPLATSTRSGKRRGVFISYSHADAEWLERLQKHLKPLQRDGIDVWDDTRLKAGEQWRQEIRRALAETKVAILLISADFLASDFIVTDELPPLLKAAEEDGATILPVIISPSRFGRMQSLSRFQAVNDPAKPLVQMRRAGREKALDAVAHAVEDALTR